MLDLSKYEGHTPGPWGVNTFNYETLFACNMFIEPCIAAVWRNGTNARLIADAPALLAELKALRESHARLLACVRPLQFGCLCNVSDGPCWVCELKGAIAKAEAL